MRLNLKILAVVLFITIISCSKESVFDSHMLSGNYIGAWETLPGAQLRMTIQPNDEDNGLILLLQSLKDSLDLNIVSDHEFSIDRFEQNGFSSAISGILQSDTLLLENDTYTVSDKENTQTIRKATFIRQ